MRRYEDSLIVCDLDGTLYADQNKIPQANLDAIERFCSLGGHFSIATGRGLAATEFITKAIDFKTPLIINNGHAIYSFCEDRFYYNVYLPEQIKAFTKRVFKEFSTTGIEVYSDKKIYVLRENEIVRQHLSYESVDYQTASFEQAAALPWSKLLLADSVEALDALEWYSEQNRLPEFEMLRTSTNYFEGVCTDIDKGTAVLQLASQLGVPRDRIFTIGNYYNDLELIAVGRPGAMIKGSPEALRRVSGYATKKECADGAFAEFVEYVMQL